MKIYAGFNIGFIMLNLKSPYTKIRGFDCVIMNDLIDLDLLFTHPTGKNFHFCLFAKQMLDKIFKVMPTATIDSIRCNAMHLVAGHITQWFREHRDWLKKNHHS